jgi:small GTP-binding protein
MLPRRLWLWSGLALLALLLLAFALQMLNQLIWQLSYWLPGWLIGPLLLLLLALLLLSLAPIAGPWLRALGRPGGRADRSPLPPPSRSRRQAAERNLRAIEQSLQQVRDAVERQVLEQERQRMQTELERGDLVITVFGAGSSGKTSLIRSLLGELVGEVGAAMGSTATSSRYRLRLRGLSRAVILEDTPGILEAGEAGERRERLARRLAARADLLLLVVDGDLRQAEQEVLAALASLGKRLLLVLNKCDLRGEAEEQRLLSLLRRRCADCADRLTPEDVVPASAAPQSLPRPGGQPLQPPPELQALLRRLAVVLQADGEELIADNLLLQCRQLGRATRDLLERQRRRDAEAIVERYAWIGAGAVALTPLAGVDLLATAAVHAQMVIEIGRVYEVQLGRDRAQDLALSVGRTLVALGLVKGGVTLLTAALSLNLPALLVSRALQAVVAAWLTRLAGRSFIVYFQQDQSWGDAGLQQVLQREYDLSRREDVLRQFLQTALQRVVEPLRRRQGKQLPPQPRGSRRGPRGAAAAGDRDDREH